jgi:hypothetical protein
VSSASPPGQAPGHFLVAASDGAVYTRVIGLGTMNNSIAYKQFLDRLQREGYRRFIFDLSQCEGFDSTFMGILLGVALGGGSVVVVNAGAPHRRLLGEVGIHRVVRLCEEPVELPVIDLQRLEEGPVDPGVRLRTLRAAHENLAELDTSNQEKFALFLEELRRELGEDGSTGASPG